MMALCIQLNMECSAMCYATAQLMSLGSEKASETCALCAQLCDACANECAKHDNPHCKESASACKECEAACKTVDLYF